MPSDLEIRDQRRQAIMEILRDYAIDSQGDLLALLKERGINATQSSVSRDLQALKVWRKGRSYVLPFEPEARDLDDVAGLDDVDVFLREVKPAGTHLIVVKTVVGAAQTVAVAIDSVEWSEVVGTIAGDDTVFIATAEAEGQQVLLRRLERLLGEK
jgi:transcriptional regulator of arginine metabolism